MKKITFWFTANLITLLFAAIALNGAPMTNADVIKMAKAGIDESVIISSVKNAENGFDSSAGGIIALTEAKVSKPVIDAIITRASATAAASANAANTQSADEIIMLDNGSTQTLRYIKPQVRAGTRAMGWGGVAQYCVMPGPKAALRATPSATFIVSAPEHASIESHLTLALFETRKNGTREVLMGSGGWGSISTGVPKVRIVTCTITKAADQSRAPAQHVIYTMVPVQPLKKGEYAFIANEKCFDFAVE